MNRRKLLITGTALLLSVGMGTIASPAVRAQAQAPGAGQAALGNFFNSPMGAQINDMVQKSRQLPGFADPGISNASNLLTRTDVRNHLFLNGRQTEALGEQQTNYLPSLATQMVSVFQNMFQGANLQEMSPEDRQSYLADVGTKVADKVQDTLTSFQGDQDKKAEALLKPDQVKRLHELDLQWRGPLALNDATVGEPFQLTADQKSKLSAMLKEYRATQQTARGGFMGMGGMRPGGLPGIGQPNAGKPVGGDKGNPAPPANGAGQPNAAAGNGAGDKNTGVQPPAVPGNLANFRMPSPEEMSNMMDDNNKKMVKLRKTVDEKALALLTPEQQQKWKAIQGKPFAFRTNP